MRQDTLHYSTLYTVGVLRVARPHELQAAHLDVYAERLKLARLKLNTYMCGSQTMYQTVASMEFTGR